MRSFLVIHRPLNVVTVDAMRVIDSWASSGTLEENMSTMRGRGREYEIKFGEGTVRLVELDDYSEYRISRPR